MEFKPKGSLCFLSFAFLHKKVALPNVCSIRQCVGERENKNEKKKLSMSWLSLAATNTSELVGNDVFSVLCGYKKLSVCTILYYCFIFVIAL